MCVSCYRNVQADVVIGVTMSKCYKALEPDSDNEFEKMGVRFKIITEDMYPQVAEFMYKNFFPDEPVSR